MSVPDSPRNPQRAEKPKDSDIELRLREVEHELEVANKYYRSVFDQSFPIMLGSIETDSVKLFNRAFVDLLEYSDEEMKRLRISDFDVGLTEMQIQEMMKILIEDGPRTFDTKHLTKHGRVIDVRVSARHVVIDEEAMIQAIIQDISQQKSYEQQLHHEATHDALTGIFNRRQIMSAIMVELDRAKRYSHEVSMMMLDLDHFKFFNDRYGHQTGDELLKRFVERVQSLLRSSDRLGRYGGEEFLVVLPHTNLEAALNLAERIRSEIDECVFKVRRDQIDLKVSIGVATAAIETDNFASLIDRADQALYVAKRAGRNQVRAR